MKAGNSGGKKTQNTQSYINREYGIVSKYGWNKPPMQFVKKNAFKDPKVHNAKEISRMLKEGMTSPQIAEELGISPSTVRTYIHDYQLK